MNHRPTAAACTSTSFPLKVTFVEVASTDAVFKEAMISEVEVARESGFFRKGLCRGDEGDERKREQSAFRGNMSGTIAKGFSVHSASSPYHRTQPSMIEGQPAHTCPISEMSSVKSGFQAVDDESGTKIN